MSAGTQSSARAGNRRSRAVQSGGRKAGLADPSAPRRRRGRRRLVVAFALITTLAVLTWLVAFSSVLGARSVTVRGVSPAEAQRVRDAARVPAGRPLLRLNTGAIQARVAGLPELAAALVTVSYPSTVVIRVTERVPVGYLSSDGQLMLVDRTGKQFQAVTSAPANLPQFDIAPGPAGEATGQAVAAVAAALSVAVRLQLRAIQADSADAVLLELRDGRTVRWGGADRSADKARILPTLLRQPGTVYDVTNPDQVFVR